MNFSILNQYLTEINGYYYKMDINILEFYLVFDTYFELNTRTAVRIIDYFHLHSLMAFKKPKELEQHAQKINELMKYKKMRETITNAFLYGNHDRNSDYNDWLQKLVPKKNIFYNRFLV